jgi:hypothetical protein
VVASLTDAIICATPGMPMVSSRHESNQPPQTPRGLLARERGDPARPDPAPRVHQRGQEKSDQRCGNDEPAAGEAVVGEG